MSLTLQRTQNRLAWEAKNRSLCSEDRRLSLQTICTMWINCRWPIHLFRPLWQKWKCYCGDYTSAESSFQVLGTHGKAGGSALLFSGSQFVTKVFWCDSPSPASRPLSQQLRFKTWHWCTQTEVTMACSHVLLALTVHIVNQLHSFD